MSSKHSFASLKRAPAYEMVEEALRSKILDGSLAPGDLLPVEFDLAQQLGVTRPTVREALRKLETTGLVERGPRRRLRVTAPSSRIASDAMHQAIVLHGISYRELWEVNMALEPAAAALAAEKIDDDLLEKLEQNLAFTKKNMDNAKSLVSADFEFHDLVAQASGNHALRLSREPLGEFMFSAWGTVIVKQDAGKRLYDAHNRIFKAIKNGDVETAREWMAKHIRDFLKGCKMAGIPLDGPVRDVNKKMNIKNVGKLSGDDRND